MVFLLRREANSPDWTGTWQRHRRDGRRYLEFHYDIVRIWEQALEPLLTGGLSLLPLAPLTDEAAPKLPDVIDRLKDRIHGVQPERAGKLWASTNLLMGLRYEDALIESLFQGVPGMEESSTYRAIIRKGKQLGVREGERQMLLRIGASRFGPPSKDVAEAIQAINDTEQLEHLGERMLVVSSWQELLAAP